MKLTFKKERGETGLAAVGNPWSATQIKGDGKYIGMIGPPNWQKELWDVRLIVKTEAGRNWKWVFLKRKFNEEPEARQLEDF